MDKLFKILSGLFYFAIILVLGLLVFALFPIKGNYQIKIVQSGSMEPTLRTGGIVIIKPGIVYKVGDIVTFGKDTKKDVPTTHRIVAERSENGMTFFTTKGDANENNDVDEINQVSIIGKVLFSVPFVGFIIDFARKPGGFLLLIIIPACIVIFDETKKIIVEIRQMKKKKNGKMVEDESKEL